MLGDTKVSFNSLGESWCKQRSCILSIGTSQPSNIWASASPSPPADPQEMSNHRQHGPTTHATSPTVRTCSAGVSLGSLPSAEEPALAPLPRAVGLLCGAPSLSAAAPGLTATPAARSEEQQGLGEEKPWGKQALKFPHTWGKGGSPGNPHQRQQPPATWYQSRASAPLCHHPLLRAGQGSLLPTGNRLITRCQGIRDTFHPGGRVTGQGTQPATLRNSCPQKWPLKHRKENEGEHGRKGVRM